MTFLLEDDSGIALGGSTFLVERFARVDLLLTRTEALSLLIMETEVIDVGEVLTSIWDF